MLSWSLQLSVYLAWGKEGGRKWQMPDLLFLEKSTKDLYPSEHAPRLVNKYPSCIQQTFVKLCFGAVFKLGLL